MAVSKNNEGRCCDAVLRILEAEHGALRTGVTRDTLDQPGVEVVCMIGGQRYAMEHTLIEPFRDAHQSGIAFSKVVNPDFEASLREVLRPGFIYYIWIDTFAFNGKRGKELQELRAQLLAWARCAFAQMPHPGDEWPRVTNATGEVPDSPVRVVLQCCKARQHAGGNLLAGRLAPPDLEALRATRLAKAIRDKAPKLHATRLPDTRTVLVVENNDVALTNAGLVGQAFDDLAIHATHMPDDIYMVDTYSGDSFFVTQIRRDGKLCMLLGREIGDWEYKAEELTAF